MAYELFPEVHGATLRARLEDTYASGVTVVSTDVYRCPPEATFNSFVRTFIERQSQASVISGLRNSAGQAMAEYNIDFNLDHKVINNPTLTPQGSIAGVPQCDLFLRAGGWQVAHTNNTDYPATDIKPDDVTLAGNTTDQILTYTYKPRSTGVNLTSARFQYDEVSELGTEGLRHDIQGARHGWSLNFGQGGEHWVYSATGKGLATPPSAITPSTSETFDDNDAIVALGGNYSITKFATTAATFGKGSETGTASTLQAFCSSMVLESNLEVQEIAAPNGEFGIAQVRYVAGRPQLKVVIDQVVWNQDFDIYSFMNNGDAIRVSHAVPIPGASPTSFVVFKGTFQITSIVKGADNGYRNAELTLDYLFPQNGSDVGGLVADPGLTLRWVTTV